MHFSGSEGLLAMRTMKIPSILITLSFLIFSLYLAAGANAENVDSATAEYEIKQTLNDLFEALKSGDIARLQRLFAGEMYARNKTLLEKNTGYSDFLINHYSNVKFEITAISPQREGMLATFTAFFPDGSYKTTDLLFVQRTADIGHKQSLSEPALVNWVIIRQVNE